MLKEFKVKCPKCALAFLSEVELPDPVPVAEAKENSAEVGKMEEVASLQDQIADLSSPEHEQEIIRNWALELSPEAYLEVGKHLGFDASMPDEAALGEEANKQPEATLEEPELEYYFDGMTLKAKEKVSG